MTGYYLLAFILGGIAAYLIGSIPNAVIIGTRFYGIDIRKQGSGNTGSTNTIRTLGLVPGLIVFFLDVAKGALGTLAAMGIAHLVENIAVSSGAATSASTMITSGIYGELLLVAGALLSVIGHVYSPFLHFHGGKGVATTLGTLLVLAPITAGLVVVVFFALVLSTRYVSVGSMAAAISCPIFMLVFYHGYWIYLVWGLVITAIVLYTHRSNIGRLIHHEEPTFSIGHAKRKEDRS